MSADSGQSWRFDEPIVQAGNRGRLDLSHLTLLEDRETKQIILAYLRSYYAYKSNEWATVRLAVK